MVKERNQYVDIMRGIAMLLVVLGHTMTGGTLNSERSILYNIIWSLQMPLFILISGYVTKYSRDLSTYNDLWNFIKRKTISYIFPWIIWSIGIRGLLLGERAFLNIRFILWNMDSGYWFLATIWTINIILGIAIFCAKKVINTIGFKQQVVIAVVYGIGMFGLLGIGMIFGMSFFAIKLTLYYMPFYFAGYLYGQYGDKIKRIKKGNVILDMIIATSLFVWLFIILRYSIYNMSDNGVSIIIRAFVSLTGCIAVCGLGYRSIEKSIIIYSKITSKKIIYGFFYWFGKHSLEVYLLHYLFLNILKTKELYLFSSIVGYGLTFSNYILTLMVCYIVITILRESDILKKILCLR